MRRPPLSIARVESAGAWQIDPRRIGIDRDRSDPIFRADRRTKKSFRAA